jgi:hypothetical protein
MLDHRVLYAQMPARLSCTVMLRIHTAATETMPTTISNTLLSTEQRLWLLSTASLLLLARLVGPTMTLPLCHQPVTPMRVQLLFNPLLAPTIALAVARVRPFYPRRRPREATVKEETDRSRAVARSRVPTVPLYGDNAVVRHGPEPPVAHRELASSSTNITRSA